MKININKNVKMKNIDTCEHAYTHILREHTKNTHGITLLSLVITVIVLLILAAVTLTLTLGNNGIFKTAEKAGENYTKAQEKELSDLASLDERLKEITDGLGVTTGEGTTGGSTSTPSTGESAESR